MHQAKPIGEITLDLDSSVSETYGEQEGSAYNVELPEPSEGRYSLGDLLVLGVKTGRPVGDTCSS